MLLSRNAGMPAMVQAFNEKLEQIKKEGLNKKNQVIIKKMEQLYLELMSINNFLLNSEESKNYTYFLDKEELKYVIKSDKGIIFNIDINGRKNIN